MVLCLLCLKIIEDRLDPIKTNSTRWQELDVGKKLEKHFWSLNTIQDNSWICLSCWQEVDDFHKFYLQIEKAHMNFYLIKVEGGVSVDCKEELITQISNTRNCDEESCEDNMAYCFLEPEILINQIQPHEKTDTGVEAYKEIATVNAADEINENDMPLQQAIKSQESQNGLASKDPLAKSNNSSVEKSKKHKHSKRKALEHKKSRDYKTKVLKVKEEPTDSDINSDSVSDNNDNIDDNYRSDKNFPRNLRSKGKCYRKSEENEKFIAENFKHMFCNLCQVPFNDFSEMQKHFVETHQQRGYLLCCNRKYFRRRLLVDHIRCHLNPDYFKCDKCGKVMSDRLRLEKHVMWVHGSKEVLKKHRCDECGKSFATANCLRRHKPTHLPEEEKKFHCNECGKFYASSYLLQHHFQAVHLKKSAKICYVCGKSISSSGEYITHMNKHLGVPEPIISCDICGLRVTTERGLKRHKDGQHPIGGKKEHQCPKCPKKSPTIKALRKHINTMHEKGYDHKCTICQKVFKRAEVLREHMASHTGTPLYTCPWCPKTFNSNSNMHAHRKKIHPKEWEEAKLQKYSPNLIPTIVNNN